MDETKYHDIDSLLSYIKNMYLAQMHVQQDIFKRSPEDVERTILIDPGTISAIDFDVETGDEKYKFLYRQGYEATRIYYRNMLMKQE